MASKSELLLPICQDTKSFEERQKSIWEKMHDRMEQRRKEWQDEMELLRKDFFRLKPDNKMRLDCGGSDRILEKAVDKNSMIVDSGHGQKYFRVSFDVSQFEPEEISVKCEDQKLIVHAKHEETGQSKSVSCEFSRQVDLPNNVDPHLLRSTLSNDGILQVEAEVPNLGIKPVRYDKLHSYGSNLSTFPCQQLVGHGVTTEHDGSKQFYVSVEIGEEFQPEDLVIKTIDRKLIVHARHEEKTPGRSSCKEFNREFDLPEGVDPNQVTASLVTDGKLVLEAPISYARDHVLSRSTWKHGSNNGT